MKMRIKKSVLQAFKRGESKKRHELKELFTDVYGGPEPWNIVRIYSSGVFSAISDLGNWRPRQMPIPHYHISITHDQTEQREELVALLRKYGDAWEPWKKELQKFKGGGEELTKSKG